MPSNAFTRASTSWRVRDSLVTSGSAMIAPTRMRGLSGSEQRVDFGAGRLGLRERVMQQGSYDGGIVELEIGEDRRDLERMREIGIAGGAGLRAVRLHGVDIGAVQKVFVGIGIVGPDAFDQVVLPHHPRTRRLGRLYRRRRGRRHGDRFGRGLHLGCAAAPIRHAITAFTSGPSE